MWESIKELIENENYTQAREELDKEKASSEYKDDIFAILDASVYEALGDKERMYDAIAMGLACNPENYELYYLLGSYYCEKNPNQAFLCLQNAMLYCNSKEDINLIRNEMNYLRQNYDITVRNTNIVIVSYNAYYFLQKNIESIRNTLLEGTYQIIVVDNASDDGITEWLAEQKDVILIRNRENKGFACACNQGADIVSEKEEVRENDIFLLNNDTRLAANSLFWLRMGLYENDGIGSVGSYSNYAGNEQQLDIAFTLPDEYLQYGARINIPRKHPYEERVRLSGFAMLVKRNVWNLIGGMDERFTPGYFEDDDLSMQIQQRGFRLLLCKNSFIYHAGSQSFVHREDVDQILLENHQLFIKKYGFDILKYSVPNRDFSSSFFSEKDEFNILQVGSGLGADLKWMQTVYPKAHIVGIEPDENLYRIAAGTGIVFRNVEEMSEVFKAPVFDVLIIGHRVFGTLAEHDKKVLAGLCKREYVLLPKRNPYKEFSFEKIKLVIWDLDDTFWQGTLSEENVIFQEKNIQLIQDLTDCGILNSISSKNEESQVYAALTQLSLDSFFVFNDINWDNKGMQIKQKLMDMGLRAENVLFIDDNARNLDEACYINSGLLTASPDIIPYLANYIYQCQSSDPDHRRLNQYKILEKKRSSQKQFDTQEAFLFDSNIQIAIMDNCIDELDRITELVKRTNQLNFTKVRSNREEILRMISDDWMNSGYIKVSDRYGDYGIVGFYCYNRQRSRLEHFLFSCRILGMKVEQYVYEKLACPKIDIIQPVACLLEQGVSVPWISERKEIQHSINAPKDNRVRILMKGPCDMSAIESYLTGGKVTTEFNYINNKNFITAGQNHSMHIWESANCQDTEISAMLKEVPFLLHGDFETMLFQKEYHIICYSLLTDCHAGLYRNRKSGFYVSFGSVNYDLTDENNMQGYLDGTMTNHFFPFTEKIIKDFAENWEFIGTTPPEQLIRNLQYIYDHALGKPRFILFLGSEIEYEGKNEEFADHAQRHKKINRLVEKFAKDKRRIILVNTTDFIHTQADYVDCINHFSRNVYYNLATEVCSCINPILL